MNVSEFKTLENQHKRYTNYIDNFIHQTVVF